MLKTFVQVKNVYMILKQFTSDRFVKERCILHKDQIASVMYAISNLFGLYIEYNYTEEYRGFYLRRVGFWVFVPVSLEELYMVNKEFESIYKLKAFA